MHTHIVDLQSVLVSGVQQGDTLYICGCVCVCVYTFVFHILLPYGLSDGIEHSSLC